MYTVICDLFCSTRRCYRAKPRFPLSALDFRFTVPEHTVALYAAWHIPGRLIL